MATFYLTFGQKYRREVHPQLGARPELPDGWLTVEADNYHDARAAVIAAIGTAWSDLFTPTGDESAWYPVGDLGTLQRALAHHRG